MDTPPAFGNIQIEQTPPNVLPFEESAPPAPPPLVPAIPSFKNDASDPSVILRLRLLVAAHRAVRRGRIWRRLGWTALSLFVSTILALTVSLCLFWAIYNHPEQSARIYRDEWGRVTYYIDNRQVSREDHDYYINALSNRVEAMLISVPTGMLAFGLSLLSFWLVSRSFGKTRMAGVEAQIASLNADHADAVRRWGGVDILRYPAMVEEILQIEVAAGNPVGKNP